MNKSRITISCLIAVLILIISCGPKISLKPVDNDTIVYLTIDDADSMDMHHAYDTASAEVLYNVYDGLIEYKPGKINQYLPRISENVPSVAAGTILNGGKKYIFKIRKGVKFHNGNELTPSDVEYSIKRAMLLDPDGSPVWMFLVPLLDTSRLKPLIEKYVGKKWDEIFLAENTPNPQYVAKLESFYREIVDPAVEVEGNKVIFSLKKPFPSFLNILAQYSSQAMILDKEWSVEQGLWNGEVNGWWKYYSPKKEDSPIYAKTMGSGPYKLVNWNRAQKKFILERNDEYFRKPASIRRVIIQGISELSTRKAMLEKGAADIAYFDSEYLSQAQEMEGIVINSDLPLLQIDSVQYNWLVKSDSKYIGSGKLDGNGIPPDFFTDQNVRLGLSHVFDEDTFINDVVNGLGFIPPTCLPKGLLGYNDKLPRNEYNIEKAKSYLKKAFNGKLWNIGLKMLILYNIGNITRKNAAELLAAGLAKVNPKFIAEVRAVEWPTLLDARKNEMMPIFLCGWQVDYPDPDNFIYTYYHSQGDWAHFYGKNYRQYASVKRAELENMSLDQIIEKARVTINKNERKRLYDIIQRFVVKKGIGRPILQKYGFNVFHKNIKGYVHNPMRDDDHYDYYQLSKDSE